MSDEDDDDDEEDYDDDDDEEDDDDDEDDGGGGDDDDDDSDGDTRGCASEREREMRGERYAEGRRRVQEKRRRGDGEGGSREGYREPAPRSLLSILTADDDDDGDGDDDVF